MASPQLVVRENDPVAGAPGLVQGGEFRQAAPNASASVAFVGLLRGAGVGLNNDYAVWVRSGAGAPAMLAREGSPVMPSLPGVQVGNIDTVTGASLFFNNAGTSAVGIGLAGPDVTASSNTGIIVGTPGNVSFFARAGAPAAGYTSPAKNYLGIECQGLNDHGVVLMTGTVASPGSSSATGSAIWTGTPGNITRVSASGESLPSPSSGTIVGYRGASLGVNDQVAFVASLSSFGNSSAIVTGLPGSLRTIARTGDIAPGTSGASFSGEFPMSTPAISPSGQVAFTATLTGAGINSNNANSLWMTDASGTLVLVAQAGSPVLIAPGDSRTIASMQLAGWQGASAFSSSGQLVFLAGFTDNSFALITVPAPSVLGALATVGLWTTRRRRLA